MTDPAVREVRVIVTGVSVSIGDLMILMLKLVVAAIPAAIIVTFAGALITGMLMAINMAGR